MKIRIPVILVGVVLSFLFLFPFTTTGNDAKDMKILDVRVHISKANNQLIMVPLLPSQFKLALLSGDGVEPSNIVKCGVYKHLAFVDEKSGIANYITLLKCGNNVYGLAEVDFSPDQP